MKQLNINQPLEEFAKDFEDGIQQGFIINPKDIGILFKFYVNLIEYFSFLRGQWQNQLKE